MALVFSPPFTPFFPYLSKFSLPFPLYLASILLALLNPRYICPRFSSLILHSSARSHKISAGSHMNLSLPFNFLSKRFQSSLLKPWLNLFLAPLPTILLCTLEFRASVYVITFHLWWPVAVSLNSQHLLLFSLSVAVSFMCLTCCPTQQSLQSQQYCSGTASSQIYPFLCLCSIQAATHLVKFQYCPGVSRR